jgi:hypothetical protein
MHGWLNNSHQKLKTFPDATESHKCPSCLPWTWGDSGAHSKMPSCWCP